MIPDETPFITRAHDHEAGGSSAAAAAPPRTQAPPAPQTGSVVSDLAAQMTMLSRSVKVLADTFVKMQQAQLEKDQKAEDRFQAIQEH